jgi:flagellar biosynthesis/type III secretory pathway chaperone
MTEPLEKLIAALREELQHYGEMLALLEQQQQHAINRAADEMLVATTAVQNQAQVIQAARRDREKCQRDLARDLAILESSTFVEIAGLLPAAYRPLVESLVDENNSLLQRVQQKARQNHLLLSRSVELMQQFMSIFLPARETQVYNGHGNRESHVLPTPPLYEAVG